MKPPAIQGYINVSEIGKSVLAALGSGTVVALALTVVEAIRSNASAEFVNPAVAALAASLLGMLADQLRRLNHGEPPKSP